MSSKNARPRWYFSLRSPYSWFCYRQLRDNDPDILAQVEWVPVWEPDERSAAALAQRDVELPLMPMSRAKNFYILQDTRRIAKERGLRMVWPIDRNPVWEVSHLAYLAAEELGAGERFLDRVYAARWERGADISDPVVIGEIAGELGLDSRSLSGAVDDDRLRRRGVEILSRVAADGVFGVPLFVLGRQKFWGTDRLDRFVAALRARAPAASSEDLLRDDAQVAIAGALSPVADGGHAGGCG